MADYIPAYSNCANQETMENMYDATEEEIIPYISKTEALVSKMEELITLI